MQLKEKGETNILKLRMSQQTVLKNKKRFFPYNVVIALFIGKEPL